jgi:hypothetical protein
MEPMERLALSWGNARQFTKLLLSLLSHIGEMVGRHGFAPCSIRVRAGASLSKFATLGGRLQGPRREGGVEPPQRGL